MYVGMKSVTFMSWEMRAVLERRKAEFRRVVEPDVAYWEPGANFYVRENFARGIRGQLHYRADPLHGRLIHGGWLGANHMHYAESRLSIRVVGVRQEPLQSAPEGFQRLEGVDPDVFLRGGQSTRDWWMDTWDKLHPKGQRWEDNPLVWVVAFAIL